TQHELDSSQPRHPSRTRQACQRRTRDHALLGRTRQQHQPRHPQHLDRRDHQLPCAARARAGRLPPPIRPPSARRLTPYATQRSVATRCHQLLRSYYRNATERFERGKGATQVRHIQQFISPHSFNLRRGRVQPVHWVLARCIWLALAALTGAASAAQGDVDLVSRAGGAGGAKADGFSDTPAISADGRFVAFHSVASNLDAPDGDTTGAVFVRDLQGNTTRLVSRAGGADGAKGNGNSSDATISADGRLVAFESGSTNLGAGGATGSDVYVRDLQANTTTLVDRASGADGAPANAFSTNAAISANGRFVAFASLASNLSPDDGELIEDVFVRDLQTNTIALVSRADGAGGATGDSDSQAAAISADGRFVVFTSFADNLDPADQTGDE